MNKHESSENLPQSQKRARTNAPTVRDIISDEITEVANQYWAPQGHDLKPFDPTLVEKIYSELINSGAPSQRIVILELSAYLENFLIKNFDAKLSTFAHVMSMVMLVNEKFRENLLNIWDAFHQKDDLFTQFFQRVVTLRSEKVMTIQEKTSYILFLIHSFQSLEDPLVRKCCLRLVTLPVWAALSQPALRKQLKAVTEMKEKWDVWSARQQASGVVDAGSMFLPALLQDFFVILRSITSTTITTTDGKLKIEYCERFLELVIDLLNQMPTRRFFFPLIQDIHFVSQCQLSFLNSAVSLPEEKVDGAESKQSTTKETVTGVGGGPGKLFSQLLQRVKFYVGFEVDNIKGLALTDNDMISRHYAQIQHLQRVAFKHFRQKLSNLALSNTAGVDNRDSLLEYLSELSVPELRELAERLGLLEPVAAAAAAKKGGQKEKEKEKKSGHTHGSAQSSQIGQIGQKDLVAESKELLIEILISNHEKRVFQRQAVREMPLYPVETLLWDPNLVPSMHYNGETVLALPKLNLQFLTLHDYLLRNYSLFQLESTYEIREDISSTIIRLRPRLSNNQKDTIFTGWARMAVPIFQFGITQVRKPLIGEVKPSLVKAEIQVDLTPFTGRVRDEWEQVRMHDILFLLTVKASPTLMKSEGLLDRRAGRRDEFNVSWEDLNCETLGVRYVRGCEVVDVLDEDKKIIGAFDAEGNRHRAKGNVRIYRVLLDAAQYQTDMTKVVESSAEDPYKTFNLLMRRKPEENNFKAVLETMRDLMQSEAAVPTWLHDVFLGYGDPSSAQYWNLNQIPAVNFSDSFLDKQHLVDSFPGMRVSFKGDGEHQQPPFRVKFPLKVAPDYHALQQAALKIVQDGGSLGVNGTTKKAPHTTPHTTDSPLEVIVESYERKMARGIEPKRNAVRFTPMQIEAIKSGLNPGLTVIVGPPGTGKTDTAVQIMSELYHNFPEQRTLLVTHSNHALNDLFAKIMERDVPERYLLRLGWGQEALETDKDFSKFGRVNHMLSRRLQLLQDVALLAKSLGMEDDVAYTCETAGHFFLFHVQRRWEQFKLQVQADEKLYNQDPNAFPIEEVSDDSDPWIVTPPPGLFTTDNKSTEEKVAVKTEKGDSKSKSTTAVGDEMVDIDAPPMMTKERKFAMIIKKYFPFRKYFTYLNGGVPLFKSESFMADFRVAEECYRNLSQSFVELEETRPFELLRTGVDRGNFLLTKHAKVIAMTCTHAAIRRGELVKLNFQYDNLIMEEAAQILEIETFIPMVLQTDDPEFGNRLKRVILLGDHHQLPPVIQNMAFQKYSHMDQSMFTRFVRLGMPVVQLNAQGRMRPSLAQLWNWRYQNLGNLPAVHQTKFTKSNIGFVHEFQLVNVEDYMGVGESTPQAYFYQNLGEAEFVVQTYMYLRLMGVAADRISLITTYNGQKALLEDIINQRCARNPLFGPPSKISTVDKYQGQQNDFILLSLVRTRAAGHVRDIRRLVVSMSRARLGLYVFGRVSLFQNCVELTRTFNVLLQRPSELALCPGERTGDGSRTIDQTVPPAAVVVVKDVTQMGQIVLKLTEVAQQEYNLNRERWEKEQEEERRKLEERQRREAELSKQMEEEQRELFLRSREEEKERKFAEQTAQMDLELAGAEADAPDAEKDEDDEKQEDAN